SVGVMSSIRFFPARDRSLPLGHASGGWFTGMGPRLAVASGFVGRRFRYRQAGDSPSMGQGVALLLVPQKPPGHKKKFASFYRVKRIYARGSRPKLTGHAGASWLVSPPCLAAGPVL